VIFGTLLRPSYSGYRGLAADGQGTALTVGAGSPQPFHLEHRRSVISLNPMLMIVAANKLRSVR
jgi:hypothetical protein